MSQPSLPLSDLLRGTPYLGYLYAYPHKRAYGPLEPAIPLTEVWADEPLDALFLYLHVPFCEMRCGFCNLFTTQKHDLVDAMLAAMERQARRVSAALAGARFARLAIGGGTPTLLNEPRLAKCTSSTTRAPRLVGRFTKTGSSRMIPVQR